MSLVKSLTATLVPFVALSVTTVSTFVEVAAVSLSLKLQTDNASKAKNSNGKFSASNVNRSKHSAQARVAPNRTPDRTPKQSADRTPKPSSSGNSGSGSVRRSKPTHTGSTSRNQHETQIASQITSQITSEHRVTSDQREDINKSKELGNINKREKINLTSQPFSQPLSAAVSSVRAKERVEREVLNLERKHLTENKHTESNLYVQKHNSQSRTVEREGTPCGNVNNQNINNPNFIYGNNAGKNQIQNINGHNNIGYNNIGYNNTGYTTINGQLVQIPPHRLRFTENQKQTVQVLVNHMMEQELNRLGSELKRVASRNELKKVTSRNELRKVTSENAIKNATQKASENTDKNTDKKLNTDTTHKSATNTVKTVKQNTASVHPAKNLTEAKPSTLQIDESQFGPPGIDPSQFGPPGIDPSQFDPLPVAEASQAAEPPQEVHSSQQTHKDTANFNSRIDSKVFLEGSDSEASDFFSDSQVSQIKEEEPQVVGNQSQDQSQRQSQPRQSQSQSQPAQSQRQSQPERSQPTQSQQQQVIAELPLHLARTPDEWEQYLNFYTQTAHQLVLQGCVGLDAGGKPVYQLGVDARGRPIYSYDYKNPVEKSRSRLNEQSSSRLNEQSSRKVHDKDCQSQSNSRQACTVKSRSVAHQSPTRQEKNMEKNKENSKENSKEKSNAPDSRRQENLQTLYQMLETARWQNKQNQIAQEAQDAQLANNSVSRDQKLKAESVENEGRGQKNQK